MDTQAFFKLTYGLYVVGVKNKDDFGGCVVDAVMQTTIDPPTLVIALNKGSKTNECIRETKEFTLSVLSETTDPFIIGNFGFQSCRTAKKWEKVPHHFMNGLPVLNNAAACLLCRVTEIKELSTHILFFCDITDAADGEGKALSYTEYQESWKVKVMQAFQSGQCTLTQEKGEKKKGEEEEEHQIYIKQIIEEDNLELIQTETERQKNMNIIIHETFFEIDYMDIPILHYCIMKKAIRCFKFLILNGANTSLELKIDEDNENHEYKWDCMTISICFGEWEMMKILEERGINKLNNPNVWEAAALTHRNNLLKLFQIMIKLIIFKNV